ncbi:3-hydroxyacyl-ACP dehydratase FabZ [Candidatus Bealeia paramacronuclearis]|uniref:3-hydroxyacyl-[acyl-carrier-protein] dehydratase FabZ n=1 Tax=Candidatus Bealeia paramacronuclearis TaxID=1921001 RepID=A0ABZ2C8V8_9PROT|nr:3-hydroxyacyl-ACP dehydratase FabZ [Candidatus Bealeia paramacronuclearis]
MTTLTNEKPVMTPDSITIEYDEIIRLIPHRFPMLLIEKIIDVVPGESAVGIKNVSINEWYFQGHFPKKPVMPGVLIIEAMAQTAAAMVMHYLGTHDKEKLVYFMGIDEAKFRKMVGPGDVLHLSVKKHQQRGPVWRFKCEAYVNGELVAEAMETAMIADN